MNLEEVYKQIDAEAEEAALVYPCSAGDDDPLPRPHVNGVRKAFYIKGATPYAEKWQEEKERSANALKEIKEIHARYNKVFGDNPAANHLLNIAIEILTPKTNTDDTDNG